MINNEFNIIGIAVSEYERDNWDNCVLRVEIEKMGSKEGNVFEAEVKIYGNNRMVDTSRPIKGEQVAVNGYIDYFTSRKGQNILRLVAQRVYVLGEQKARLLSASDTPVDYDPPEPSRIQPSPSVGEFPQSDDDLPF